MKPRLARKPGEIHFNAACRSPRMASSSLQAMRGSSCRVSRHSRRRMYLCTFRGLAEAASGDRGHFCWRNVSRAHRNVARANFIRALSGG